MNEAKQEWLEPVFNQVPVVVVVGGVKALLIAVVMASSIPLMMLLLIMPLNWDRVGMHDVVRKAMLMAARINKHF
jgi:hypothetical protein